MCQGEDPAQGKPAPLPPGKSVERLRGEREDRGLREGDSPRERKKRDIESLGDDSKGQSWQVVSLLSSSPPNPKVFIVINSNLTFFSFIVCAFGVICKNAMFNSVSQTFSPVFF